ncbi:hypothetical protein GJAV_G00248410 [Gymnothorax javanicus]|nr:hypothetical protein GJAV_G00248410 [Gymnothorax javanicus]
MEDGVKEDTAKPKEAKFMGKAGWVKKSTGKFLGSYKDRYIQVERSEIVIYENEDLKSCLERVDLECYDKCHELRGTFQKKNRLILIRGPKCGNKIHDVKIQAQNSEEKDAWIKALNDGINRAKNKIFDEVTVDDSCSLEHVTRSRPKGNQGRRPPTRIHMKEVANQSSDGILRKDLDATDNTPNGTHQVNTEADASVKAVKPPMPPHSKPSESPQEAQPTPQKKVLKPPMPPSKERKPTSPDEGETLKEVESATPIPSDEPGDSVEQPDSIPIAQPPSPAPVRESMRPPTPPSKDKKPTQTVEWEVPLQPCDIKDSEKESADETLSSDDQKKKDADKLDNKGDRTSPPPKAAVSSPEIKIGSTDLERANEPFHEEEGSGPALIVHEKEEPDLSSNAAPEAEGNQALAITLTTLETQSPATSPSKSAEPSPRAIKKNHGPPAIPKKKPLNHSEGNQPCELKEVSAEVHISAESRDASPPGESVPTTVISDIPEHDGDQVPTVEPKDKMAAKSTVDMANITMFPGHTELGRKEEESSECQHLEDVPQVDNIKGASLAEAESAEDHVSQKVKVDTDAKSRVQMPQQVQIKQGIQPTAPALPLKPSKSASMGNLLLEPGVQGTELAVKETFSASPGNDTKELHSKVALELEDTEELLDAVSSQQNKLGSQDDKEGATTLSPEELLTKAVEKLRKADQFLREAKILKGDNSFEKKCRMSW